ncbi:MAG: divalent-cation tolerance protein CutA [Deltaproteobacteria bacterium]|nr:divalent-cation tolerance protein CutA [Deltaproteobacteria bacterium]
MSAWLILSTAGTEREGLRIAHKIVEERLAACANVIRGVTSFFYWEGKLCQEKEVVILIKTAEGKLEKLINKIKEVHSYTVPEIIFLKVEGGEKKYLEWVKQVVKK